MPADTSALKQPLAGVRSALSELASNACYLRKELPSLSVPNDVRAEMASTCDRFEEALAEVRIRQGTLTDSLYYPEPDADPGPVMAAMSGRLDEAMQCVHRTVVVLDRHPTQDAGMSVASILLTECATKMLVAQAQLDGSCSAIRAALDQPPGKDGPLPDLQYTFRCAACARVAGRVELFGAGEGMRISRLCFTSLMEGPVAAEWRDKIRIAVAGGIASLLYRYDLEMAAFYCPKCEACYCGDHWNPWDVFETDEGYTSHDCIRGRCPKGHERMLED